MICVQTVRDSRTIYERSEESNSSSGFVIGQISRQHVPYHPTTLIKTSGMLNLPPLPPRAPSTNPNAVAPSPHATNLSPTGHNASAVQYPPPPPSPYKGAAAAKAAAANIQYPPVPVPPGYNAPNQPTYQTSPPAQQWQAAAQPPLGPPPQSQPQWNQVPPPPPLLPNTQSPQYSQPQLSVHSNVQVPSTGWQPLFFQDATPSPAFKALMEAFFVHLDPYKTGTLSPEVYSGFLDVQGYNIAHNVCEYNRVNIQEFRN